MQPRRRTGLPWGGPEVEQSCENVSSWSVKGGEEVGGVRVWGTYTPGAEGRGSSEGMEPPWKSLSVIVVTAFFFDMAAAEVEPAGAGDGRLMSLSVRREVRSIRVCCLQLSRRSFV